MQSLIKFCKRQIQNLWKVWYYYVAPDSMVKEKITRSKSKNEHTYVIESVWCCSPRLSTWWLDRVKSKAIASKVCDVALDSLFDVIINPKSRAYVPKYTWHGPWLFALWLNLSRKWSISTDIIHLASSSQVAMITEKVWCSPRLSTR